MAKRVLDVGQCSADHAAITGFLQRNFEAEVARTHGAADTLSALRKNRFDLVLINRKLDSDGSDGIEILKQIKADPGLSSIPVMLVSNYADQQQLAVAAGAVSGFGKAALHQPETSEILRQVLG